MGTKQNDRTSSQVSFLCHFIPKLRCLVKLSQPKVPKTMIRKVGRKISGLSIDFIDTEGSS